MLRLAQTRMQADRYEAVASGVTINQEGMALVAASENGNLVVTPSAGSGSENFVGISLDYTKLASELSMFGTGVATTTSFQLPRVPINGQVRIVNNANGNALTLVSGAPNTGEVQVNYTTGAITLNAAQSGISLTYSLKSALTVDEAVMLFGEGFPGVLGQRQIASTIGVITQGQVATDQYDISGAWTAGAPVRLGANGRFTQSGSGNLLDKVLVKQVPANGPDGFLTLELLP